MPPPYPNCIFNDERVAGGQRLDLGIAEGRFVHILCHSDRGLAGHDLSNEFLLVFHKLVKVSVKRTLGYIAEDFHLLVFIPLTDNTAQPLLKVGRPPGAIQIVQGDQPVLYVSASAHLLSASHQHSYLPGTDFRKQRLLFTSLSASWMNAISSSGIPCSMSFFSDRHIR